MRWIDAHPLRQFCFVRDWVLDAKDEELREGLTDVLFWLALDYRLERMTCTCLACEADTGVPLARVWLSVRAQGTRRACHVLAVNAYPPYRRLLSRACWSVGPGSLHMGELLWLPLDQARNLVRERGMTESVQHFIIPAKPETLNKRLSESHKPELRGDKIVLQWVDTPFGDQRVIGARAS